jgi:hypothetical protein
MRRRYPTAFLTRSGRWLRGRPRARAFEDCWLWGKFIVSVGLVVGCVREARVPSQRVVGYPW